jgi:hypothetical protein
LVGHDALVDGGECVPWAFTEDFLGLALLGAADEVDATALLPAVPLAEVDAGLVPHPEDPTSLGGALAEGVGVQALEGAHVVFLEAGTAVAGGQVNRAVVAEVECVELAGGVLHAVGEFVMSGGGVEVTVAGEDGEVVEFGILGERIGADLAGEGLKGGVEFLDQAQATVRAGEEEAMGRKIYSSATSQGNTGPGRRYLALPREKVVGLGPGGATSPRARRRQREGS